jgi:hypothetical protein
MTLDDIEAEISTRIATKHSMAEGATNTRQRDKCRAQAQALAELQSWFRFQKMLHRRRVMNKNWFPPVPEKKA